MRACIDRLRRRVKAGFITQGEHGNTRNRHAERDDHEAIASWLQDYAVCVGETAPLRRRRRETRDGCAVVRYETEIYTLLDTILLCLLYICF